MDRSDLTNAEWFKSTYSNGQAECVEVARLRDGIAMRDSKRPSGPALRFTSDEWQAFVNGAAGGAFDQP